MVEFVAGGHEAKVRFFLPRQRFFTNMLKIDTEYAQLLVDRANTLLAERRFEDVLRDILVAHNNYRSGWTEDISQLFHQPANETEQELSNQFAEIIRQTVRGLLETAKPATDLLGYALLEYIATFLHRLGKEAPTDLVATTRKLIEESQALGAPKRSLIIIPALQLLSEIEVKS